MLKNIESGLQVGVAIRVVLTDLMPGKVSLSGSIEGIGQFVTACLASAGVGAPTCDIVPTIAFPGSIDVNTDQEDVPLTKVFTEGIYPPYTFFKADIVLFRYQ